MSKKIRGLRFPDKMTITGRSSAIRAAFIKSIIPSKEPSDKEIDEALAILSHTNNGKYCAYCAQTEATEWDHFRPIVNEKEPTGFATDIYNIVPSCGKCNQSKGSSNWLDWIKNSNAPLSPISRNVANLEIIIRNLETFEKWSDPKTLKLENHILKGKELKQYLDSCEVLLRSLNDYQEKANELKLKFHSTK